MDSEGLYFHIIELQTHTSGYIFVCESIGWNYNYLGLQFGKLFSIYFSCPKVT
jgi:hypothetical protein